MCKERCPSPQEVERQSVVVESKLGEMLAELDSFHRSWRFCVNVRSSAHSHTQQQQRSAASTTQGKCFNNPSRRGLSSSRRGRRATRTPHAPPKLHIFTHNEGSEIHPLALFHSYTSRPLRLSANVVDSGRGGDGGGGGCRLSTE